MNKKICFFLSRTSDIRDLSLIIQKLLDNDYIVTLFLEEIIKYEKLKKLKNHGVCENLEKFEKNNNFSIRYFKPKSILFCRILRTINSLICYLKRDKIFDKLTKRYSENTFYLKFF